MGKRCEWNNETQIGGICDIMKKVAFILGIVFIILTFIGAGYVLYNGGKVNAGYAVVPMIFALACLAYYRKKRNEEDTD